jgi:ribonuclease HII
VPLTWQLEHQHGWPDTPVAGVDEAGRGPWAGPVVAAAIILPADFALSGPLSVDDSKKLSEKKREAIFEQLVALPHGIGQASVDEIDQLNILQATFLAMTRAVDGLTQAPAHVLVDGNHLPTWDRSATAVIGGDGLSPSIAAASILAKVTRDRIMRQLDADFPVYGWASNKGYGAKAHQIGLAEHGVSPHHRKSYAPIRKILSPEDPI